jgi:membrane-bound ClpP family serine protease
MAYPVTTQPTSARVAPRLAWMWISRLKSASALLALGLLGLYLEFKMPGVIAPGIAGVLCLVFFAIKRRTYC